MQAIAYVRVSTEEQAKDDRFGLDRQREVIKTLAKEQNVEIKKWFSEEGVSGSADIDGRPAFLSLIEYCKSHPEIDVLLIAKTDRIARDVELYYVFKHCLRGLGVLIKANADDFTTKEDKIKKIILDNQEALTANLERYFITERTSGGRRLKAKQGGYSGGRPPFGYKAVNRKLEIEPQEAMVVEIVFKLREQGKTLQRIADYLNNNKYRQRNGTWFTIAQIKNILDHKKLYEGYYKYGDMDYVKGIHEPILK